MLVKKTIYISLLLAMSLFLQSQNKTVDASLLIDKAVKKLYQNPEDCISFSQNLSVNTKDEEQKIILENIIAQSYAIKGDFVQSIKTSLEGDNFSEATHLNPFTQFYMAYSLAEQYQNLGLYQQSENIIAKTLKSKERLKHQNPNVKITLAKIYQLNGINLSILQKLKEAEVAFKNSNNLLDINNTENQIIKGENQLMFANILISQNKIQDAENQILSVLKSPNIDELNHLSALAKTNLSRIYFLKKDNITAIKYLEEALKKTEPSGYLPLNSKIYELLSKNYSVLQNTDQQNVYNKRFLDTKSKLDSNKKDGIRYLIKLVETQESKNLAYIKTTKSNNTLYLILAFASCLLAMSIYYWYVKKTSNELKKQVDFFENLKLIEANKQTNNSTTSIVIDKTIDEPEKADKKTISISKEKEKEILLKLSELEKSERFLNKNMSLATLAGQLDTNTKYLSEVINSYKGKNFNGYINDLRINHIAYLLKTNPTYLNYKVSYLAEISGFSSHSAFTTVFKTVTGMSPNSYIQQINESKS